MTAADRLRDEGFREGFEQGFREGFEQAVGRRLLEAERHALIELSRERARQALLRRQAIRRLGSALERWAESGLPRAE